MRRLALCAVLALAGCIGHVFAAPFFIAAELEEAACKAKLPKGTTDPNGHGLIYVCREPKGSTPGHWELFATNCSDLEPPGFDGGCYEGAQPCAESVRCELVDGGSAWVPQYPPLPAPCFDTAPADHDANLSGCQTLCGAQPATLQEEPCNNACTCGGASQLTDEPTPK